MVSVTRRLRVIANEWRQAASYSNRDDVSIGRPHAFQIEATNYCNLRCPMCPHDLMTREVGFMDMDLYRRVIDEVREYTSEVRLHNMGESLFHKRLDEFIQYAQANGVRTVLSSNASALTERAGLRIIDSGLDELLISFDGTTKETYEVLREGAKYEKVLEKIGRFLELKAARKSTTPRVTMSLINMPMTSPEVQAFRAKWQGRVDSVRVKPARNWDGSSERINDLVQIRGTRQVTAPCSWLWTRLVVLWDGRVVPCCMDYDGKAILGNVKDKTLAEIFNDEPMRQLRRVHLEGRVNESSLCRGCAWPTSMDGALVNAIGKAARWLGQAGQGPAAGSR